NGELRPGKGGIDAGAAALVDGARQFGDQGKARGGDRHTRLGHAALEGLEARGVVDLLRQQTIALLHGTLEMTDPGAVARIEAGHQTIEEAPAFGGGAGEETIQGRRDPNELDVFVERRGGVRFTVDAHQPPGPADLFRFERKPGAEFDWT